MFWAAAIFFSLRLAKVNLAPVQSSGDLAIAIQTGNIVGPHNLHPRLPIAVESVPAQDGAEKSWTGDCAFIEGCSREAWSDFGLGLAGLIEKEHLCQKYTPAKSCVSEALSTCVRFLDASEKKNLLSFARIMVSWCSDNTQPPQEVESEVAECDNLALFNGISAHGCLSEVVPHPPDLHSSSVSAQDPDSNSDLPNLVNSFFKNYYDTSTISCLYSAMEEACGKGAADASLGKALRKTENITSSGDDEKPIISSTPVLDSRNHSHRKSFSFWLFFVILVLYYLLL